MLYKSYIKCLRTYQGGGRGQEWLQAAQQLSHERWGGRVLQAGQAVQQAHQAASKQKVEVRNRK